MKRSTEVYINATAMREAEANSAKELVSETKKVKGELSLLFFEGRGALKSLFTIYVPGSIYSVEFRGDKGWEDYHRDPDIFFKIAEEVEKIDSTVLSKKWKKKAEKSLKSAIMDIRQTEKRILKYHDLSESAPKSWLKNCRSLPKELADKHPSTMWQRIRIWWNLSDLNPIYW